MLLYTTQNHVILLIVSTLALFSTEALRRHDKNIFSSRYNDL